MASSGMLRRVALVRTDVSEELSASFIRPRIGELGTTLAVTNCNLKSYNVVPSSPILVILMKEAPSSSETLVLTIATRRNIPEDAILQSVMGVDDGVQQSESPSLWILHIVRNSKQLANKNFGYWMCFRFQVRGRRRLVRWVPQK
jgi:hypothetical protein